MTIIHKTTLFSEMTIDKNQIAVTSFRTIETGDILIQFENSSGTKWYVKIHPDDAVRLGFINFQKLEYYTKGFEK